MRPLVLFTLGVLAVDPVSAQGQTTLPRFYIGASTGLDGGSRGNIPGGAVPSAGGLVGFRITDAWSVEVELERGFRTTGRTDEAVWISFAPPNSTLPEIERLGIRARFDRTQTAGPGFTAQAVWCSREPGRVNVGLFAGVAARAYQSRVVRTTLHVPPEANLSADHPYVQAEDERRTITGGGPSGGLLIFVTHNRPRDNCAGASLHAQSRERRSLSRVPYRCTRNLVVLAWFIARAFVPCPSLFPPPPLPPRRLPLLPPHP